MNYILHFSIYLAVYVLLAVSLNLITGYCGLLSLAHAGYFAVGAYAYAIAALRLQLGFLPALGIAAVVASALSLALSLPAWRLSGDFFVMTSLAVQALFWSALNNWYSVGRTVGTWRNLTNGPFGIDSVPKPAIVGIAFDTMSSMFAISAAVAAVLLFGMWRLIHSPWGRLLNSMRDDELVLRGLGKNTRFLKVQAFIVSCVIAASAGCLYAAYVGFIDPTLASLDSSILLISMVLVGGLGNFRGPFVGAAILLAIPEMLRSAGVPPLIAPQLRLLAYGLSLVLMMHFRPQGLAGIYRSDR